MASGKVSTLPLVIKGDVDGSVQALSDALEQLGTDEVQVERMIGNAVATYGGLSGVVNNASGGVAGSCCHSASVGCSIGFSF